MSSVSTMALVKVFEGINLFLTIINWLIMAYVIMSWIMRPNNALFQIVSRFTQPILAPFRPIARKLIEKGLMIDITPILAFLAISVVRNLLLSLFTWILT